MRLQSKSFILLSALSFDCQNRRFRKTVVSIIVNNMCASFELQSLIGCVEC